MIDALVAMRDDESSFEAVYERLEAAVSRLEDGGLGLEESIALYETGMRLAKRCKEMLDAAELRVTELDTELAPGDPEQDENDENDEFDEAE